MSLFLKTLSSKYIYSTKTHWILRIILITCIVLSIVYFETITVYINYPIIITILILLIIGFFVFFELFSFVEGYKTTKQLMKELYPNGQRKRSTDIGNTKNWATIYSKYYENGNLETKVYSENGKIYKREIFNIDGVLISTEKLDLTDNLNTRRGLENNDINLKSKIIDTSKKGKKQFVHNKNTTPLNYDEVRKWAKCCILNEKNYSSIEKLVNQGKINLGSSSNNRKEFLKKDDTSIREMILKEEFKQQGKENAEYFLKINKKNIFWIFDKIDNELRKIGSFGNIELKNDNDIHNLAQEIKLLQTLYFNYKKTSSSIILAFLPFINYKFEFTRDLYRNN